MKVASVSNNNISLPVQKRNMQADCKPVFKSSVPAYKKISGMQKLYYKIFNKNLCDCNYSMLEGVQRGLKSFEGLSIKQMAFAFTDLHSINMISGCTNHCLHCYANAQPYIKRYPFEDLVQICSDVKEFKSRTGLNLAYHHGTPYIDAFFDADALDCHLYDKSGEKHDYIEIAKIMGEGLGYKPVFDTNGWGLNDKKKQAVAEEYVSKLLKDENYKNFYQVNISINPFSPKYAKVLNFGYPLDELYSPLVGIDEVDNHPEDFKKARDLYRDYLKSVANVLYTFKPLLKANNFSLIVRALDGKITEMKGYRIEDFVLTLQHIYAQLYLQYVMFGEMSEGELRKYGDMLGCLGGKMFSSGRMEKFFKVKNQGKLTGIDKIDSDREATERDFDRIKIYESLKKARKRYLKMMAPDGKVYLYDNYSIIPTDVQIKTSTPDIARPFMIPVKDFVVTDKMIDLI